MRKLTFVLGFGVGYVLGTRAGRQRYEQISRTARRVMDSPTVQSAAGVVGAQVDKAREKAMHTLHRERTPAESFAGRGESNGVVT